VEERNGPIDALVVAIGAIEDYTHFSQIGEQAWSQDLWVNLGAPFFLARAAILSMQSSGRCGRVVLFSSESSRHGSGSHSLAYGAAKAGIDFVARALAKDCAKDGILVNAISPGFVETGFHERWQCKSQLEIEERIEMIPLRRAGTVDEVAGLVEFLLSQDGGFITGTSVSVAGGDWL
jgi:3-oxoacyl-[acyl-carrier protein] reductase